MDPEVFAVLGAGVAGFLAVLGLRRRTSTSVATPEGQPGSSAGATVALAGASASRTVSNAVASAGHQVLTVAAGGVSAAGTAVSKGAGLVVDGGISLVQAVRPGSRSGAPAPAPEVSPASPVTAGRTRRAKQ